MFFLFGCNSDLTEEEKKALWDNAQTRGEIIRRSGTPFNLATDPDLAMSDAENRLMTGGGLIGEKANFSFLGDDEGDSSQVTNLGMPINPYLWKASLETISFMPLASTDPFAGTIITDWYTDDSDSTKSIKITVRFLSNEIRSDSLKIIVHQKNCKSVNNCKVNLLEKSQIRNELRSVILKKAALIAKEDKTKKN